MKLKEKKRSFFFFIKIIIIKREFSSSNTFSEEDLKEFLIKCYGEQDPEIMIKYCKFYLHKSDFEVLDTFPFKKLPEKFRKYATKVSENFRKYQ